MTKRYKWLDGTLDHYEYRLTWAWVAIYFVFIGYVAGSLLHK